MKEKIVKPKKDLTLYTENFGNPKDPAVLLIAGATVSMLYWDEKFCEQLAAKGLFVIRYDNRDVGRSTHYSPGKPPYDVLDMTSDAISMLDAYNIKSAHFAGISLGGLLSQLGALTHPQRVASLTLISTGPWGPSHPDIPEMDKRILDFQAKADDVNWTNEDEVSDYMVQSFKLMAGDKAFNQEAIETYVRAEFRRAGNYKSMFNHAQLEGGEEYYGKLSEISQPALIIHGTKDKIWHYLNAKSLKAGLANSKLVTLEGSGHELHPQDWDTIITQIAYHVQSSNR